MVFQIDRLINVKYNDVIQLPGYEDDDRRNKQWKYQDIDSFISMTTLPPPPDLSEDVTGSNVADVGDDLANLIIPPPPLNVGQADEDDDVSTDSTETLKGDTKISPKIAMLQSQLKKTSPDEPYGSPSKVPRFVEYVFMNNNLVLLWVFNLNIC